ncbi:MAG: hypothetical protein V3U87_17400 [Methylococcaceae bacterium]
MKQTIDSTLPEKETTDLPTIITVLCHLMTLYAIKPSYPLAANINQHILILLKSPEADSLGEWKGTFRQLLIQWKSLAAQHTQKPNKDQNNELRHFVSH